MSADIHFDRTVRTVIARLTANERMPSYRNDTSNAWVHWFIGVEATLTFTDGELTTVNIRGPKVRKDGQPHATQWAAWTWPMDNRPDEVATIWEANPPQSLVEVLNDLGVTK